MKGRTRKSSKLRAERPTSKSRRPRRASLHFFGLRNSTSENEMSNSLTVGNMCHFVLGRGRTNMTSYVILSLMMIHTVKKKSYFCLTISSQVQRTPVFFGVSFRSLLLSSFHLCSFLLKFLYILFIQFLPVLLPRGRKNLTTSYLNL